MKIRPHILRVIAMITAALALTACSPDAESSSQKEVVERGLLADVDAVMGESDPATEPVAEGNEFLIDQVTGMEQTGTVYSQTILVYMVGSDLESQSSCATMDLWEMEEAQLDTDSHHVIVYAGGTTDWNHSEIDDQENAILELTEDGFVKTESLDIANTGDAQTLRDFISYGISRYDTDQYSLILWDHGGGPVMGFGADENYYEDDNDLYGIPAYLSLNELCQALDEGLDGARLEWIGFDACLMNALEVADALTPYANYLIASQETEPGYGWYYQFLSQLSQPDMDGARTGQAIIDAYFEYGNAVFEMDPSYYCDLTLSCLDLNQYQIAEDTWDSFFSQMNGNLSTETFPSVVRDRDRVKLFGSFSSNFNYSLVDAVHLLQLFSESSGLSADPAITALQDMVVYQRSNVANANGVSVCYPQDTIPEYVQICQDVQEEIGFSEHYVSFWKNCDAIANGETIYSDWDIAKAKTDVTSITADTAPDTISSGSDISLVLTPEQQQNLGSASYFILRKAADVDKLADDPRAEEMYFFIHAGTNVEMDENGVLHAYYSDQVVYMKDTATDELSPVPMILIENESSKTEQRYLSNVVLYDDLLDEDFNCCAAQLQIVVNDEYPDGIIRQAIPISDEEEEEPIMRQAQKDLLDLDDFTYISVVGRCSYLTRDTDGNMMSFFDWEESGWSLGFELNLQTGYSLEVQPIDNPEYYYCMFVVEDAQGNTTFSELIPLAES